MRRLHRRSGHSQPHMQMPDNLAGKDVDLAAGKTSLHPGGGEAHWKGEVFKKVVAVGNVREERRW